MQRRSFQVLKSAIKSLWTRYSDFRALLLVTIWCTCQSLNSPLSILSSKFDDSTQPPTRLVLVQWVGQAPEDSTWESWDELKAQYHLEDKVDFEEGGVDSNIHTERDTKFTDRGAASNTHTGITRPIRNTQPPHYLKDYIT
ncbi:hypothetical protein GmHk_14G042173 [Glycine max]|nr:hypothetical protein GmHk_14G042173 [Glycine max]